MTNIEDVDQMEMMDFLVSFMEALDPTPEQAYAAVDFLEQESIPLKYWVDESGQFSCTFIKNEPS